MKIFRKLTKAVVDTVMLPIDVAKDSVSLGGLADHRDQSYSFERLHKVRRSLKSAYDELDKG